ncbi:MAG TPA: CRISPR-associated protein Cas4 [Stellaceae bacterium]|nr:CRISPR-associated protein Cas4 [Stellaceae bacterium]
MSRSSSDSAIGQNSGANLAPVDPAVEDALIPLSALQHFVFCPRQCALIHVEQVWAEDGATAEGRLLHERVDAGGLEHRPGVRVARGLMLRSLTLGVAGRADVVAFRDDVPYPVEYKRGRPKSHRADEVQLCAQAICLEEMFGVAVPEGALFYGAVRRRVAVAFDTELRSLTARVAADTRAMITAGETPPPVYTPVCRRCSLYDSCQPQRLEKPPRVARWLAGQLAD